VEILRFGPGFRRSRPVGAEGLAAGTIWSDPGARVTDLAFSRRARLGPETSPDHGLFIVIAGAGWVQVADERSAVNHGEAVEWPAGVSHAAWTDGTAMRALLVELPARRIEAGTGRAPVPVEAEDGAGTSRVARGALAEREGRPEAHDAVEGEPW
jgi:mannose-6-phosphate isomerase-like protein (cupin superfamily)